MQSRDDIFASLMDDYRTGRRDVAVESLLRFFRRDIRNIIYPFQKFAPREDLYSEACITFVCDVLKNYDPSRGGINRFRAFARTCLERKLIAYCAEHLEYPTDNCRKVYPTVMKACMDLSKIGEQLPSRDELIKESIARISSMKIFSGWSDNRKESAIRDVIDTLERKGIFSPEGERTTKKATRIYIDPPIVFVDQILHIYEILSRQIKDRNIACKCLVLFTLHSNETENISWEELLGWLKDDPCPHEVWPAIHKEYKLPPDVPTDWYEIQKLFQNPPPKLTVDALKQFYHRYQKLIE